MAWEIGKWNAEHAASWERTRAKGKLRYFLRVTSSMALLWGSLFSLKDYLFSDNEIGFRPEALIKRISVNFAVGIVMGMFFSLIFWLDKERNYKAFKQQDEHY